jgi:hypothetical protein
LTQRGKTKHKEFEIKYYAFELESVSLGEIALSPKLRQLVTLPSEDEEEKHC